MQSISSAAIPKISEFGTQQLSNTSWSYAVLKLVHTPLLNAISSKALETIELFDHFHSTRPRLMELVFDLTALAWAFEFMFCLDCKLHESIKLVELEIGKVLDDQLTKGARALQVPPRVDLPVECVG